jgi:hypothetical protein
MLEALLVAINEGYIQGFCCPAILSAGKLKTLDKIFDPFVGTGAAALLLGRRFTGCEVDRRFIDIAVRRLVETDVPDAHPE